MTQPPLTVSLADARAQLSALVTRVHTFGERVHLTSHRRPAGALVPMDDLGRAGLTIATAHSCNNARKDWARVHDASHTHPQGLTSEGGHLAVLIGVDHLCLLEEGPRELPGEWVTFDGQRLVTDTGVEITPGPYLVDGQVVVFARHDTETE